MSKKWKIIGSVAAAMGVVTVVSVVALVYFGGQFINHMRGVAQGLYGGPLPAHIQNIIAVDLEKSKMGVFLDKNTQTVMILMEKPQSSDPKRPFSEPEVAKALEGLGNSEKEVKNALQGSSTGEKATLPLLGQTVHTLKYTDSKGQNSVVGVLNLDRHQLVFIATAANPPQDQVIANFLSAMPLLQKDSRVSSKKPQ